jgi:catechol 2,3-dioxygenase-like lactoylglutathione lyase family enzyme
MLCRRDEVIMAGLADAKPIVVVCTRNRTRAATFYRDTLGLTLTSEDALAAVFDVGGTAVSLSTVADFTPHEHTILGFKVSDVEAAVLGLRERGIVFNRYPGFNQDQLGILTVPGTMVRVAWFKDPDGNVLSVTDA